MRLTLLASLMLLAVNHAPGADRKQGATRNRTVEQTPVDPGAVNNPQAIGTDKSAIVRVQILLDRNHFSPGEIDGVEGANLERALRAFQSVRQLNATGQLDEQTWAALNANTGPVLITHTLTAAGVAGPFTAIPDDLLEQAKVKSLDYSDPVEKLGEQFHIKPDLLRQLNPEAKFQEGEQVLVPDIGVSPMGPAARIVVTKTGTLTAFSQDGKVLAHYPCTSGSEHDPLPIGQWTVTGVHENPVFHYNPKLFWDANPAHSKAKIAPGPNNPVGIVWIDLTKEHYGIHGTPNPSKVGHTQSHGCIRLTNWDARELARMVSKGTPVEMKEQ